ncbi:GLIPR1-like protein 2 isoform X2 [Sminthopsis crassicaudata]|uniref:GLIPR1-like protein 2 isoform X2 n=1 Tax=Sminthopsis crassicaudata TaxID=9301 RepID=UPI003D69F12F
MRPWLIILLPLIFRVKALSKSNVPAINDIEFIHECVEMHNLLRTQLTPPAANAQFITWDEGLAKTAKAWAKKCVPGSNTHLEQLRKSHPVFNGLGENIWTGPDNEYSATLAIRSWFSESKFYNYENNTCSGVCSHYIQLVWDTTYKIGCAVIECPSIGTVLNAAHFICNYALSGNPGRRPYQAGRFCSKCDKEDKCQDMLCSNNERERIAHYPYWYPEWEVPRPIVCDPLCIFCLVFRLFLLVVAVAIVFLLQHKFPNIRLEKDLLLAEILAQKKSEKDVESESDSIKSVVTTQNVRELAKP